MGSRLDLSKLLHEITPNVYFDPPSGKNMKYPAIVYELDDVDDKKANNKSYMRTKAYLIKVIDSNPDSELPDKVHDLPMSSYVDKYPSGGLHHTLYKVYY